MSMEFEVEYKRRLASIKQQEEEQKRRQKEQKKRENAKEREVFIALKAQHDEELQKLEPISEEIVLPILDGFKSVTKGSYYPYYITRSKQRTIKELDTACIEIKLLFTTDDYFHDHQLIVAVDSNKLEIKAGGKVRGAVNNPNYRESMNLKDTTFDEIKDWFKEQILDITLNRKGVTSFPEEPEEWSNPGNCM